MFNKIILLMLIHFCAVQSMDIPNVKQHIMELSSAYILSRAIHTAAELGIADFLVHGSCSITTLAHAVGAQSESLYRLMRFLASYGIFCETQERIFALTDLAMPLVSNHPESLRSWLMYHGGQIDRWSSYGNMAYSIKNEASAYNHLYGQGYFETLSHNAMLAHNFDEGMKNISLEEELMLVSAYDFAPYKKIVDIGGGKGNFLAQIVTKHTTHQGILYDLAHTIASAQDYLMHFACNNHITRVAGNFFESIPHNADLYVLKRILHDWNDEQCIQILKNCKIAMKPNARLLIIEAIIADSNERDFAKDIDMEMLVLFGGKERTLTEWQSLINKANLHIHAIHQTTSLVQIIEVTC